MKDKGLDYNELLQEYADKGDLTSETREKLAQVGFNEEFVNDFIEGKKALVAQQIAKEQSELAEYVGGKENFDNIIKWAAENISQEEKEQISTVRNMTAQKLILDGLKARMETKEGKLPTFVQGGGQTPSYCFSCQKFTPNTSTKTYMLNEDFIKGSVRTIPERVLTQQTCQKYNYRISEYKGRPIHIATYRDFEGKPVFQKIRFTDNKQGFC